MLLSIEGTPLNNREIRGSNFGTFWNQKVPSKFKPMKYDEEVYSEYSSTDETINKDIAKGNIFCARTIN